MDSVGEEAGGGSVSIKPFFARFACLLGLGTLCLPGCGRVSSSASPGDAASPNGDGSAPFDASGDTGVSDGSPAGWGNTGDPSRPWASPFPLGEPGWRQSSETFCDRRSDGTASFGVFADVRGVFVLRATGCHSLANQECRGDEGANLYLNDGRGWTQLASVPFGTDERGMGIRLAGFDAGPLIVTALRLNGAWCPIGLFDRGTVTCTPGSPAAVDLAVVNPALAYALAGDAKLYVWNGSTWTLAVQLPVGVGSIWADENIVLAAGPGFFRVRPGTWAVEPVVGAPTGGHGAIWGTGADDFWAATVGTIVHWDGTEWSSFESEIGDPLDPGILDIQGAGGHVFFHSGTTFGVIEGNRARTLVRAPPEVYPYFQIAQMHVSSATEVFIVSSGDYVTTPCGGGFAVWYDGRTFHQF